MNDEDVRPLKAEREHKTSKSDPRYAGVALCSLRSEWRTAEIFSGCVGPCWTASESFGTFVNSFTDGRSLSKVVTAQHFASVP